MTQLNRMARADDGGAQKLGRHSVLDRLEIDVLRAEFTDAVMMNNHDRITGFRTSA